MTDSPVTDAPYPHIDRRVVVMGVSGSGKSSVGEAVGAALGIAYIDGDKYHPQSNIDKMSRGEPLTDDDRAGWLAVLRDLIRDHRDRHEAVLIGCSSLKHSYRAQLRAGDPNLLFLFLDGSFEVILGRMKRRKHFFSAEMLTSQFETLEAPGEDEAIRIDIDQNFADVIHTSTSALRRRLESDAKS
ncbi:gluconokinase [Salinisphaera sp.]|uniref:gluconokinase n=1 Tax=Salinisphaera sp. TaxID=1914330 RepID=UPI002D77B290|nr:gluconokinase [Salinisphaera sp.]HET7313544.1 gluconokinase [Salinisphaera sp.]